MPDTATIEWFRRSDDFRILSLLAVLGLTVWEAAVGSPVVGSVYVAYCLWLGSAIAAKRLLRHAPRYADRVRVLILAADVAWITFMCHQLGASRWVAVAAYLFVMTFGASGLSAPATAGMILLTWCAYGVLVASEASYTHRPGLWMQVPTNRVDADDAWAAWLTGAAVLAGFAVMMRQLIALIAQSDARTRQLFEASPRPMWVYDAATLRFLAVNDAAVSDYGYSRQEFLGLRVTDLQPPDTGAGGDSAAQGVLPSGRYHHAGTWRHRRRDGSLLDVEITTHPIRVGGRDARLVIATDVTDRTRLETKLRQTQRFEALGRLAGGLAHEFNNLLAAVLAHAGLLNAALPRGAAGADSVEEIIRATQRGAELTRHLLAFGRRQILRPESVDVGGVIRDTERLLRPLLTADVRVSMELPDACWARVDRSQLELVIMNLVMNARDAMPNGGSLTMQTSVVDLALGDMERHPTVAIAPGEYVRLSVSDTGVGIAPEIRDRVFEPFFTTKPVGRGTGLGLSTVYGIVKQSDGYVWLYSETGRGTTMHVYLPCALPPALLAEPDGDSVPPAAVHSGKKTTPSVPVAAGSRGITVLVADDEEALRRAAVRILSGAGYRVLDAADGESALAVAAAASTRVDVLLTDVVMPGMGGVALASRLAEREPRLRVIYMSGYPQRHLAGEAGLPGGHAFIEKPFSVDSLLEALSEPRARKRKR